MPSSAKILYAYYFTIYIEITFPIKSVLGKKNKRYYISGTLYHSRIQSLHKFSYSLSLYNVHVLAHVHIPNI